MPRPKTVPVTCPQCGHRFTARIRSILDVGEDPELKGQLLEGKINLVSCPLCQTTGMLNAPLLYHDPPKELLLCFIPPDADLDEAGRQRLVGTLTNELMSSLSREKRKGYLLQPKVFFDLQRMTDEILQADGIAQEELDAWRTKMDLIQRLLKAPDDNLLRIMVRENDDQLDDGFFQALSLYTRSVKADGREDLAQRLLRLRQKLMELSSMGRRREARREILEALGKGMTKEDFLQKLTSCDDDAQLEGMVAAGFPLLDYWFFKTLTDRIESAQAEGKEQEAQRLTKLRSKILDTRSEVEKGERAGFQRATELLREILRSEDTEQAVRDHLDEIDDFFIAVLLTNIEGAEARGLEEETERLKRVGDFALGLLKEMMPPQVKLINQLLEAAYPEETERLLEENAEQINGELVELMDFMAVNLRQEGETETAQQLMKIREQALKMI